MKKGSVIVDLAAERGGNVEGSVVNQKIYHDGVTIIGYVDHHSRVPVHASQLLTRNLTSFLKNMSKDGQLQVDLEDDIVSATLVVDQGEIRHEGLKQAAEGVRANGTVCHLFYDFCAGALRGRGNHQQGPTDVAYPADERYECHLGNCCGGCDHQCWWR